MAVFEEFTNLYSLSKTLRFELKPVGKTLDHIKSDDILANDEHRADSYQKVKKIIDEYHKYFIEGSLHNLILDRDLLARYYELSLKKDKSDKEKKELEGENGRGGISGFLRKQISSAFDANDRKRLFGKELIKEDLVNFVQNDKLSCDFLKNESLTKDSAKILIEEFKNFTTYFTGFHENRNNMYSDEDKSTAIAYRLIHDNLPKFINNIFIFKKVEQNISTEITDLYRNLKAELGTVQIKDFFEIDYFTKVLTQSQIEIYNLVIGGKTLKDGDKIQGLNEYINLYNQKQNDKSKRLPKFTFLFKQILSDRNSLSHVTYEFLSDNEVLENIKTFYDHISTNVFNKTIEGEMSLKQLLLQLNDFDLPKIFLRNDTGLTDISQQYLGSYAIITNKIKEKFRNDNPKTQKQSQDKYDEKIDKMFSSADSFSIKFIDECLEEQSIVDYFKALGKKEGADDLFAVILQNYKSIEEILNTNYPQDKSLRQDKQNIEKIKQFLDSIKALQWFIKPLLGKGNEFDRDARFYCELDKLGFELDKITPLYNMVRNYAAKKPYSNEKIKLNFENSTLADGWDVNKEHDNTTIILRKNDLYYLAILNNDYKKVLDQNIAPNSDACFEKMEYKLLPGANKMLPKVFFSASRKDEFSPSEQLLENYQNDTHKKGETFNLKHCHQLIDFFKASINKHEDWSKFDFQFSDTSTYQDLSGFYREVEQQGYKITFRNISEAYINQLVEEGKLYLFQIYNKDFSPYSKGTPNMHTLYWKALFDSENLKNIVYKLNGQAEVFYRKKSIKDKNKIIHKANNPLDNKNKDNIKKQSTFDYDIIKDRRYTVDKFQFHVPITMNFKAKGNERINEEVNKYIKNGNVKHIIGIDRGERHLLYLSLIDLQGNIVKQFSLNEIVDEYNGAVHKVNYHDLLDKKEGDRDKARKNWQTIENIKELKEGYLSQVINKIAQMMTQYNAIVVLEDLNFGFMRGRQKVEKQVYQKFEKMLIDKLNYLCDKKKEASEYGGLLNAYQLTNKFTSFKDMGKQNGFLFYIPAWNTSKMDPVTGFVNLFDAKSGINYENITKAQEFFGKFADIRYNESKKYFEFVIDDYNKFNSKAEGTRLDWIICTNGERIETFRNSKNNQWDNNKIILTTEFIKLFEKHNIDYISKLQQSIVSQNEKEFFCKLLKLLKLTLQMRNSITGTAIDYLISPVADKDGNFYDSAQHKNGLPDNADANGAYNIARKGLWAIGQIKKADNLRKVNLAISNKEWLQFVQKK